MFSTADRRGFSIRFDTSDRRGTHSRISAHDRETIGILADHLRRDHDVHVGVRDRARARRLHRGRPFPRTKTLVRDQCDRHRRDVVFVLVRARSTAVGRGRAVGMRPANVVVRRDRVSRA